jgi:hypothetical protein
MLNMDRSQIQRLARAHSDAVVAGDEAHITADIVEELHPLIPQLAATLPTPLDGARIVSAEVFGTHGETVIEYFGPGGTLTVMARWEDRGGPHPQIVAAAPL